MKSGSRLRYYKQVCTSEPLESRMGYRTILPSTELFHALQDVKYKASLVPTFVVFSRTNNQFSQHQLGIQQFIQFNSDAIWS